MTTAIECLASSGEITAASSTASKKRHEVDDADLVPMPKDDVKAWAREVFHAEATEVQSRR